MSEKRKCVCGKEYWWPAARWQHERCEVNATERLTATNTAPVVVNAVVNTVDVVVNKASGMVVNTRTKDRHKSTAERKAYVRMKMRESRARRRAERVSGVRREPC